MKDTIGIMQGRFTNKAGFFPQQFPWYNWKDEFYVAQEYGLDCIEWMFNAEGHEKNPLWTEKGRKEILCVMEDTGIKVRSVCANYFMQNTILNKENAINTLNILSKAANELEIGHIIIPLFDASLLGDVECICEVFQDIMRVFETGSVGILLETEMSAEEQKQICEEIGSDKIGICYDVGNAQGKGYDCIKDISMLSNYIKEIHLKDKNVGGTSVMLGKGQVDFREVFRVAKKDSSIIYILESYFEENAKEDTIKNISYVRERMII